MSRDLAVLDPTSAATWLAERSQGGMEPGSVLIHAPTFAFQAPGGGENQLLQTARHLEAIGRTVRLFSSWTDRLTDARLLHLFGMSREGLELAKVARARGVPVVLSPICWVEPRAVAALASSRGRMIWDLAKWAGKAAFPRLSGWRRTLLAMADAVLPNSQAERRQLVRLFGADPDRVHVVPNGVEPRFADADPGAFRARYSERDFVLYVGRIEPRKNVLALVKSVRKAALPMLVIGDIVPGHEGYGAACQREGGTSVTWIPRVEHDDPLLASAYAASRVFALPSWFETPGLAALEAALARRAVVVTPFGSTREYFGPLVRYARPDRPAAITRAVKDAWELGPDPRLAAHVADRFLWSVVARKTAEVYDQVAG